MCESHPNSVHRLRSVHTWTDPNSTSKAFKYELTPEAQPTEGWMELEACTPPD